MQFKTLLVLSAIMVFAFSLSASAMPYYVWQDTNDDGVKDVLLGTVMSYSGGLSAYDNYNYFFESAHPVNGPTPEIFKSKMYLYEGSDGLSFGFFHNIDEGGNNYWNHVKWEIDFTNMTSDLGFVDDIPENRGEIGVVKTANHYDCGWAYILNTDGGVINNLSPTAPYWEIIINPSQFGDIQEWQMASNDGNDISLWTSLSGLPAGLDRSDDYYRNTSAYTTFITPAMIPEPTTMLLLGAGLIGSGIIAYRRRKAI